MKDKQMYKKEKVIEELADITQKEDMTTQSMKIPTAEAQAEKNI